jgi:lipid-binding SYLF domain-containing protein
MKRTISIFIIGLILFESSLIAVGQTTVRALNVSYPCQREAILRSQAAATIFMSLIGNEGRTIPQDILNRAEAVAIFPGWLKFGPVFEGGYGSGIVSIRDCQTGRWGEPLYLTISGGSFFPNKNNDQVDLVLIALNPATADKFESYSFDFNSVSGPLSNEEANNVCDDLIVSYTLKCGQICGIIINNSSIWQDQNINCAAYQEEHPISREASYLPANRIMLFSNTLQRYSARQ